MRRILITGGSGLLALNWACCMRGTSELMLAPHTRKIRLSGVSSAPLDLESVSALTSQIESARPDLVVHTAGITNVDLCEQQPETAMHVNAELARNVAIATGRLNIKLIHISTDHLFDGSKALSTEEDPPHPLNVYARSKLQAERWVQQENARALILRTNFFGWGHRYRQSFSDWIIFSLRAGKPITMFDNAYFTPMLIDALALSAHACAEQDESGIVHLGGPERISKFEFATRLARVFGLPEELIRRGRLSRSSLAAERPLDMSLDSAVAQRKLGGNPGSLDEYFSTLRAQESAGRQRELSTAVME